MADSPNTPSLPKIHPSRRTALAGIAGTLALATGVVGAVAVSAAQSAENPDAELIALCDRYIREWAAYNDALNREGDAQEAAQDSRPECPAQLYEPLEFVDGLKEPSNSPPSPKRPYWSRGLLEAYAKPDSTSWRNEVEDGEGVRTIRMLTFPIPEATRARARELLPIFDRWEAEIKAGEAEWRKLEALSAEQGDTCSALLEEISEIEPQTMAGITALAKLSLDGGMLDGGYSEDYEAVLRAILEGVIRLNGGSVA